MCPVYYGPGAQPLLHSAFFDLFSRSFFIPLSTTSAQTLPAVGISCLNELGRTIQSQRTTRQRFMRFRRFPTVRAARSSRRIKASGPDPPHASGPKGGSVTPGVRVMCSDRMGDDVRPKVPGQRTGCLSTRETTWEGSEKQPCRVFRADRPVEKHDKSYHRWDQVPNSSKGHH